MLGQTLCWALGRGGGGSSLEASWADGEETEVRWSRPGSVLALHLFLSLLGKGRQRTNSMPCEGDRERVYEQAWLSRQARWSRVEPQLWPQQGALVPPHILPHLLSQEERDLAPLPGHFSHRRHRQQTPGRRSSRKSSMSKPGRVQMSITR